MLECTMASRHILLILRVTKAPVSVYKRDAHCRHANLGRLRTRRKAYLLRLYLFGSSQTSTIHSAQSWNGNGKVLNISRFSLLQRLLAATQAYSNKMVWLNETTMYTRCTAYFQAHLVVEAQHTQEEAITMRNKFVPGLMWTLKKTQRGRIWSQEHSKSLVSTLQIRSWTTTSLVTYARKDSRMIFHWMRISNIHADIHFVRQQVPCCNPSFVRPMALC